MTLDSMSSRSYETYDPWDIALGLEDMKAADDGPPVVRGSYLTSWYALADALAGGCGENIAPQPYRLAGWHEVPVSLPRPSRPAPLSHTVDAHQCARERRLKTQGEWNARQRRSIEIAAAAKRAQKTAGSVPEYLRAACERGRKARQDRISRNEDPREIQIKPGAEMYTTAANNFGFMREYARRMKDRRAARKFLKLIGKAD